MMINNFQKAMLNNIDVAWEIIKIFHPDIVEEYPNNHKKNTMNNTKERLKINFKYDWVCIEIPFKKVSIGIKFECNLCSGSKPLHLFEKELDNNKFRAWRFADDSKCKIGSVPKIEADYYNDEINKILSFHNIPKPTAKQMSDYYHSD